MQHTNFLSLYLYETRRKHCVYVNGLLLYSILFFLKVSPNLKLKKGTAISIFIRASLKYLNKRINLKIYIFFEIEYRLEISNAIQRTFSTLDAITPFRALSKLVSAQNGASSRKPALPVMNLPQDQR